ncbi:MAG: hypothetical protein WC879_10030 [Melioribacteraceae bacterium]
MGLNKVKVGNRYIGEGEPVYIIAEIGINHNGLMELAKKLIDGAVFNCYRWRGYNGFYKRSSGLR